MDKDRLLDGPEELARLRALHSEQTHLIATLQSSLAELRETYDQAPDPCITIEAATGIVSSSNLTLSRLLGLPVQEIVGSSLLDLLICESRSEAEQLLQELRQLGIVQDREVTLSKADGTEIQVSLNSNAIRHSDGTIDRCILVLRDVTHLRQARESQARLAFIVESSADAIISKTLEGTVTSWNRGAEDLFGITAEEIVGQSIEKIVPEDKIDELRSVHLDLKLNGMAKHFETVRLRKDGTRIDVTHTVSPVRDAVGNLLGVSAILRDISKRKAFEEGIQRAQLAAEEALHAAENANRAKSAFLANMSHEIRTPLNGIMGFTELMRRTEVDESTRQEYLDIIYSSGTHLLSLINEILDLSKVEAGGIELELQPCSPQAILDDVLSVLRVQAATKMIELKSRWLTRRPETIICDPQRLRQMILNLLGNAIKFTESGSVSLEASILENPSRPQLAIAFIDTGIGIRTEHLEKIFSPFDQADNSMTRRFGGTGLGLTICRRIAREMGGDITVESEFGKGSRFTLTLNAGAMQDISFASPPPALPIHSSGPRKQPQHSSQASAGLQLAGIHILLCEDGETNRQLFELVLKDAGAQVHAVENGQLGVEAIERGDDYDIILMDMQMPVLDGYSASERIRSMGWTKPIIALTAHAMRGDREKCRNSGCSGYIAKPIDFDELLGTVTEATCHTEPAPLTRLPSSPAYRSGATVDLTAAARTVDTAATATVVAANATTDKIRCSRATERVEIQTIIEQFVDDLDARIDEVRDAIESLDFEAVSQFAHKLRGSGGTIGFDCFTVPAEQLELSANAREAERARQLLTDIESLCGRIELPWR